MAAYDETARQQLEELAGARQQRGRAAVRLDDLDTLLRLPDSLTAAKAAGTAPTKAEFDALVDDVTVLLNRLLGVVLALRARRGR